MHATYLQVGVLIGKAGDTIRYLQLNSGAKIQITRDVDADPHSATRPVELIGTLESIEKAEKLMSAVIAEVGYHIKSLCWSVSLFSCYYSITFCCVLLKFYRLMPEVLLLL